MLFDIILVVCSIRYLLKLCIIMKVNFTFASLLLKLYVPSVISITCFSRFDNNRHGDHLDSLEKHFLLSALS